MSIGGAIRVNCAEVFPGGLGVVGAVSSLDDFNASTKEVRVQARDKETGLLMWQVDVIDFDPEARERTFRVKIAAPHQPVPPEAIAGLPIRPVILEGLTVTPYIKDGPRPRIAYSLKATGLRAPNRAGGSADAGKAA